MSDTKIIVRDQYCPKNHTCPVISRCPTGAITQKNPVSAPEIDEDACLSCGLCTKLCRVYACQGC